MRQPKKVRICDVCGAIMKRTIGAQTRRKYWACTDEECGRRVPA